MIANKFSSVHDYLDELFKDKDPSDTAIVMAKKAYWRAYNTDLKRRRRKLYPTFQISFSTEDVLIIKSRLQKGQSVSKYIHELVAQHLQDNRELQPKINTALIEQQLFLIGEYLRELLDYNNIDMDKITTLERYIQTLETVIQDSL